jgi:hypothetical protein
MKLRYFRWVVGILMIMVALPFLVWGFWPVSRLSRQVNLPSSIVSQGDRSVSPTTIWVSWPAWMQAGREAEITVQFQSDDTAGNQGSKPAAIGGNGWSIEARLEMPNVAVSPAGAVIHSVSSKSIPPFSWQIRPGGGGRKQGTIWLHLINTEVTKDQNNSRYLVAAQPIALQAATCVGINAYLAQVLGVLGLVIGVALSADILIALFTKRRGLR